jgi:hypothetical protein
MRKLWLALLFLAGGCAQELRHPTDCHCITASRTSGVRRRANGLDL